MALLIGLDMWYKRHQEAGPSSQSHFDIMYLSPKEMRPKEMMTRIEYKVKFALKSDLSYRYDAYDADRYYGYDDDDY